MIVGVKKMIADWKESVEGLEDCWEDNRQFSDSGNPIGAISYVFNSPEEIRHDLKVYSFPIYENEYIGDTCHNMAELEEQLKILAAEDFVVRTAMGRVKLCLTIREWRQWRCLELEDTYIAIFAKWEEVSNDNETNG